MAPRPAWHHDRVAPRFELVIFDNDGVLVDSEVLANTVLAGVLAGAGLEYSVERCMAEFVGSSLARVRGLVEAGSGRPLPAGFEDDYHRHLFSRFAGELRPVTRVAGVLDALRSAGAAVCVASSGTPERIALALRTTGLDSYFGGRVFSASDPQVARGKPAPDLFLHAAASMGVEPARCAVIEDSVPGVEAAVAAGMTVFAYAERTPAGCLAGASRVVTAMADLVPLLLTGTDLPAPDLGVCRIR